METTSLRNWKQAPTGKEVAPLTVATVSQRVMAPVIPLGYLQNENKKGVFRELLMYTL